MRNEYGRPKKMCEDSNLQAPLNEDDTQTQQQRVDQLHVTGEANSICLKGMGKVRFR